MAKFLGLVVAKACVVEMLQRIRKSQHTARDLTFFE